MNTTSSAGSTTRCIAIARAPCAPRVSTMSSGSNASPSSALNERGGLLGDAIRHVVGEPSTVLGNAPSLQRLHVPMQSWELGVPGYEVARLRVAAVPAQLGVEEPLEQRTQRFQLAKRDVGKSHGREPTTVSTTAGAEGACLENEAFDVPLRD